MRSILISKFDNAADKKKRKVRFLVENQPENFQSIMNK